jgi:hypothetical protein
MKSVKTLKAKTDSLEEITRGKTSSDQTKKPAKVDFVFRNILAIPHVLTKAWELIHMIPKM